MKFSLCERIDKYDVCIIRTKRELEEVNDLGQLDSAAVAWELINNIIEKNVGGGLCDGGLGGH